MKSRFVLGSLAVFLIGTGYVLRPQPVTVTLHALRNPETVYWRGRLASPRVRDFHFFRAALMNHYRYPPLPFPERVRYRVTLSMQLLVTEPGSYDFELVSPWFGALEVDGERVFGSGPLFPNRGPRGSVVLAPGVHETRLILQPSDASTGEVRLLWTPPGDRHRDIGPGDLLNPSSPRLHRLAGLSTPLLWIGGLLAGFTLMGWVWVQESTRRTRMVGALLLGLIALAARTTNYAYFPRVAGDELNNAWVGWNLLHEGRPKGWSRLPVYPESQNVIWFGRSFPIIPEAFEHPPLLQIVLGTSSTLAGAENMYQNTPERYRPPMIVFGTLSVILLFLIAARLFDFRTAFLAGGLMALSPLTVFSARLAKEDGLVQLLWLAGLWVYLHIRERKNTPRWDYLLGAILGLATLSKIPGLVLGFAFAVTAVVDGRDYRRAARLLSVSLAVGALFPLYGYLLNASLFHDVMAYMGGRFSVEDVSQKLLIIPRFILEPKLGAGVPFIDGWILLGWLSLPFLFSKRYLSIPFVSYLFVLALTIHSERHYGFYIIPVFPILLLGAALGIRRAYLRPAVLPTFLFVTLFFLIPTREIAGSLPFGFRTLLFVAYLPVAMVFLRDAGWRAAEPVRRAMLHAMVVLGFLFAAYQCFSTI